MVVRSHYRPPLSPFFDIADFCAGGDNDSSPIGTLKDIIVLNGYNETSLPYSALEYYEGVSFFARVIV